MSGPEWGGWLDSLGALDHMRLSIGSAPDGTFRGGIASVARLRETEPPLDQDTWIGLGVLRPEATGRGKAVDVVRLLGVWADLDAKEGGCGDMVTCAAVVTDLEAVLGCPATYTVMSGHGLQPVWVVKVDGTSADEQKALLARFGRLVEKVAADHGGAVDAVFDPARILRAPHTVNWKDPAAPVPVEYRNGGEQRLTWTELRDVLDGHAVAEPAAAAAGPAVVLDPDWWTPGEPCPAVAKALRLAKEQMASGRHPAIVRAQTRLARHGEQGHQGTARALEDLRVEFLSQVTGDGSRSAAEAAREWDQALDGVTLESTTPPLEKGCCGPVIDEAAILAAGASTGITAEDAGTDITAEDAYAEWLQRQQDIENRKALFRLRANQWAKQALAAERSSEQVLPDAMDWDELDAVPEPSWAIDEVLPEQGHCLLVAQAKAGKSTLMAGLVRSISTGDPFLGEFAVNCKGSSIQLLDLELGPSQLRRYYLGAYSKGDPFTIRPMRGRLGALNLLAEEALDRLATAVEGTGLLIIDPLGPLLAANGVDENDNTGVRQVLNALNALMADAGIPRMIVVHHFGHGAERARGASVLQDWRDTQWRITLDNPSDPATSQRFFAADGRDGAPVHERPVLLDHHGGPYLGTGTKGTAKAAAKHREYEERVLQVVDDSTVPLTRNGLVTAVGGRKQPVMDAIRSLVDSGFLEEFVPAGESIKHLRRS